MSKHELVLGIDLGGTNFRIGLVNKCGEVLQYKVERSSLLIRTEQNSLEILVRYIERYLAEYLDGLLIGIAVGFPTTVSKDKTMIYPAPNLKLSGFEQVNISAYISSRMKVPVFIEKDVNLLLIGDLVEMKLDKLGITLGMYIGTGFGNSIYINGKFLEGKNGVAGELGHIPAYHEERLCGCGNVGCAEVYASGLALNKIKNEIYPDTPIGDIFSLHGSDTVIREYIDGLSLPVATEINIFDPDYIIIGGGIPAMKDFPKKYFEQCIIAHTRKPYPAEALLILYSENRREAGVIGAGLYALEKLSKPVKSEEKSWKN